MTAQYIHIPKVLADEYEARRIGDTVAAANEVSSIPLANPYAKIEGAGTYLFSLTELKELYMDAKAHSRSKGPLPEVVRRAYRLLCIQLADLVFNIDIPSPNNLTLTSHD